MVLWDVRGRAESALNAIRPRPISQLIFGKRQGPCERWEYLMPLGRGRSPSKPTSERLTPRARGLQSRLRRSILRLEGDIRLCRVLSAILREKEIAMRRLRWANSSSIEETAP